MRNRELLIFLTTSVLWIGLLLIVKQGYDKQINEMEQACPYLKTKF